MKKNLISGSKPSGILTLGNYLGAIKNWKELQDEYNCIYFVADLHCITEPQDPKTLLERTLQFFALYLACGLDDKKNIFFIQSHVPAHSQLAWVLNCTAYMGELNRMTQFKDKVAKGELNNNAGLFTYPVLQAADILLYDAHVVPVGEDQKQHVEITRDIAIRFNNRYGETFVIPECYMPAAGAKIKSLGDPLKKMSKSDQSSAGNISIIDEPEVIISKFKKAVTDSEGRIYADEKKPGVTNLLNIYALFKGISLKAAEKEFDGKLYGAFKTAVAETVAEGLKGIRNEYKRIIADAEYIKRVYKNGAEKASMIADKKLKEVYEKVGFVASI
jgi:tryptophanyl-tRNA synthetase